MANPSQKLPVASLTVSAKNAPSQEDVRLHDAVLALISLGYKQVEAHKAIRAVMKTGDEMPTSEELIRQALKILS